jgi:hypothetical protein
MGVCLAAASRRGDTVLDRERSRPNAWTTERVRCRPAGIPAARGVATTPPRAQPRLARACTAGGPAPWVTGDRVYEEERRRRLGVAAPPQASVLAVSGPAEGWLGGRPRPVQPSLAALPEAGWTRRRAGDGPQGPRWYDGRWRSLADPVEPAWRRWRLGRRRVRAPSARTASVVFAPQATTGEAVVPVAGTRGILESGFEAANGAVGLEK